MKLRPIIFSGPMVRAILEGRKTQTRRVVKPQPRFHADGGPGWYPDGDAKQRKHYGTLDHFRRGMPTDFCPYGVPGDRLWVREAFFASLSNIAPDPVNERPVSYRATEPNAVQKWKPSIHMPRWASRIKLEVTGVRIERLQEISEENAKAEGVDWQQCPTRQTEQSFQAQLAAHRIGMCAHYEAEPIYVGGFSRLWDSINAKRAPWSSNPWVWVIEFRRAHG